MNLLTMEHLTKVYTERKLFDDTDFSISEGEKIGVIGINGTGKSTLLKIAAGLVQPDEGTVARGRQVTVRYLKQQPKFEDSMTALEAVMEGNRTEQNIWSLESEARSMLNLLKIENALQPMGELSGGQKKRVALAQTLLSQADILILDEPTNHLDNTMARWLEDYLIRFRGAVLMVTHDRYFLDRAATRIVELDKGKIYSYPGSYSEFVRLKEARQNVELAAQRKRKSILKTELEWLARGARARATKQKAHIQRIEEMQALQNPAADATIEMHSAGARMGKKTIEIENISKSYAEKTLFTGYSYIFLKGDRIGIIGENGCGKSTLLKVILGEEAPDTGTVVFGETIKPGYFSQDSLVMDDHMRVIDYIKEVGEYVTAKEGKITAAMMLERFLFDGAMQWNPIGKLSGGERRRLQLLRVLMSGPNVLILDEPTNDLDIQTLTILEDYLDSFEGIVITVSHDRYFLDRIVGRIFAFEENGKIRQYEGGYSDYLEARERSRGEELPAEGEKQQKNNVIKKPGKPREHKVKFTFKEEREYETIEGDIQELENRLAELDEEILAAATNYETLAALAKKKEKTQQDLEYHMERWEYLTELAERIKEQQ